MTLLHPHIGSPAPKRFPVSAVSIFDTFCSFYHRIEPLDVSIDPDPKYVGVTGLISFRFMFGFSSTCLVDVHFRRT